MSEVTIAQLEAQLDNSRQARDELVRLERLLQNKDFKAIVGQEFMVEEAARYVHISCDPNLGKEDRADALFIAQSGGALKRWLAIKEMMLRQKINNIPSLESDLDAARQEENEE